MLLNTGRALLTAIGPEGGIESSGLPSLASGPRFFTRSGHAGPFGRTNAVYARASGRAYRRRGRPRPGT
jgi:hypothetical protein